MQDNTILEKEFNDEFAPRINEYVLVRNQAQNPGSSGYSIFNIKERSMVVIDDPGQADYLTGRLLEANVPVYDDFAQIKHYWEGFIREPPPDLYGFKDRERRKKE